MNACDRFRIGDRVTYSEEARLMFLGKPLGRGVQRSTVDTGTVRGFGREPQIVRIQRDGLKTIESYHESYWDLVSSPISKEGR